MSFGKPLSPHPAAIAVGAAVVLWAAPAAQAGELHVTTAADAVNGDVSSVPALSASPGPDGISLREAVIATNNTPGPRTIALAPALAGQTIELTEVLPSLTRPFTTISGPLDGSGDPLVTLNAFDIPTGTSTIRIQASYVTIRGLRFTGNRNLPRPTNSITVLPGKNQFDPPGPGEMRQVRILDSEFNRSPTELGTDSGIALGTPGTQIPGNLEDAVIARNRFNGGAAVNVGPESGSVFEDVTIAENEFTGYTDGALELIESGVGARLTGTRVTRNDFHDGMLAIWMGIGSWSGPTSGNVLEDTVIDRNRFSNSSSPAVDIVGGDDTVSGTGTGVSGNTIENTRIENNLIREGADPNEILVRGGSNEAHDNTVDGLAIVSNTISDISGSTALTVLDNDVGGVNNDVRNVSVRNTIFDGNGFDDFDGVATSEVRNSITCEAGFAGTNGNVCADPAFVNPAGGDYHLQASSPAIDAGAGSDAPATDYECRARHDAPPANTGTGTPAFADIGAFEFGATPASCAGVDTAPPGHVSGLAATAGVTSVTLEWTNPSDADLSGVVVRLVAGGIPPETPEAGQAVHDGSAPSTTAEGLTPCARYSFSVFPRDTAGNFRAPVSVSATPIGPGPDTNADGCADSVDDDDDGDGLGDGADACPRGETGWTASVTTDHDTDGCRDAGEDADDDNDGILDTGDSCPQGDTGWTSSAATDHDSDGCRDASEDPDDDNDGALDSTDQCDLLRGPSPAGCPVVGRSLTLRHRNRAAFRGALSASRAACIADQKVVVFRKRRGRDKRVGSDRTSDAGRYVLEEKIRRGRYYSTTARRTIPDVATCGVARSAELRLRG